MSAVTRAGVVPSPGAGVVYLLHFDRRYGPGGGENGRGTALHYTGSTKNLPQRLAQHENGRGARLTAVVQTAGIGWTLARTWGGGRELERALKRQGGASRRCPLCGVTPRPEPLPRNKDGSVSRSRISDAQKDAAGLMTSAQLAEHTALRRGLVTGPAPGVERIKGAVPADDPWYVRPEDTHQPRAPNGSARREVEARRTEALRRPERQATEKAKSEPEHKRGGDSPQSERAEANETARSGDAEEALTKARAAMSNLRTRRAAERAEQERAARERSDYEHVRASRDDPARESICRGG